MRCQLLNLGFKDKFTDKFNFAQVDEYFKSTDSILFMRTKVDVLEHIKLKLSIQDESVAQIFIRGCERKSEEDFFEDVH